MLEAYGLAAAHLGQLKAAQDQARARRELGLGTVAGRRPGLLARLGSAIAAGALRRPPASVARPHGMGRDPSACVGF